MICGGQGGLAVSKTVNMSQAASGSTTASEGFCLQDGIYVPRAPVAHREDEYDPAGFQTLAHMQGRHFWYRGRHRFLLHAVHRFCRKTGILRVPLRLVDLGGGCGGWVRYLNERTRVTISELALADSSLTALKMASHSLPPGASRYQVDLLDLPWEGRWNVAFLLDVLEHIPDHERVLREVHRALARGGLLFVTAPALKRFWTYNDEISHHVRRYAIADFRRLSDACGFELLDVRYFMFFLSPLLLATRWWSGRRVKQLSETEMLQLAVKSHGVPPKLLNSLLAVVFAAETPSGHIVPFPFGTSILGVFRKPG